MPEITLIFDREDERALVQFLLEQGGRLVGDMQPLPQYQTLNDLDAYLSARTDERQFLVLFDEFNECPLTLYLVPSGHLSGKYHVMQRTGGPTIDLLGCVQYHKDGEDWISGGGISYYPTYKNTITGDMERPPEALVKQYKRIVSRLKKHCKLITGQSGRKYLIGPHTYQLIQEGKLKVGIKGLTEDGKGVKERGVSPNTDAEAWED